MNLNLKNFLIALGLVAALFVSTVFVVKYNTSNCEAHPEFLDSLGNVIDTTLVVDSLVIDSISPLQDTLVIE